MIKDSPNSPSDSNLLFTLRPGLEVDGSQRSVVLGMCRMLEGVQLLVDRVVDATVAVR